MKTDDLLLTASFVTNMDRKEHLAAEGRFVELQERLEHALREVASEFNLSFECFGQSVYALGAGRRPDNSGRCCICSEWVSAQNRPGVIHELGPGAEHEGELYCLEHIPSESAMYAKLNGLPL